MRVKIIINSLTYQKIRKNRIIVLISVISRKFERDINYYANRRVLRQKKGYYREFLNTVIRLCKT